MAEFIIWGKVPHGPDGDAEVLLVSEAAGIKNREKAEEVVKLLEGKFACYDVRIQKFEMGDGLELAEMFKASIKAHEVREGINQNIIARPAAA